MHGVPGMKVLALCAVLMAAPALAVNEAIAVKGPLAEQLSPSLCVSMSCEGGETAFTVATTTTGVRVLKADGRVVLDEKLRGVPSNTEALELSARILKAIEGPAPVETAKAEPSAPTSAKVKPVKKAKTPPVKLAARIRNQRRG